jgi:hypothetical protein
LWKLRKTFFTLFFPSFVSGKWRRTRRGNGIRRHPVSLARRDAHLAESLLQQDKEDGPGGSEVMIETSADSKMQEEIQEFYAWLDEGSNAMAEAGARERNNDSAGVTEVEVIVEAGGHEINDGAASVTANSGNTSKTKETGQKRKRYYFSVVQTTFLEGQLKDNKHGHTGG